MRESPIRISAHVIAILPHSCHRPVAVVDGNRSKNLNEIAVRLWTAPSLNHADCYSYLGTSVGDMKHRIDDFATEHAVLQAWHGQHTWQPLFDHADDYHRTVYEEHSVLNWFRGILQTDSGLNASKMSLQWCSNVLRMVTPHMWVCRALLKQVDRVALETVAQVTETNDAFKIALREGQALDDLELALLPILPVEAREYTSADERSVGGVYFKPSFFPAARRAIDSRMRRARVSGRLAV